MQCPHCRKELTMKEAITILNGKGFVQIALVRTADGHVTTIEAGLVNPNTVEVLG
jgi:hypothetical protein